MKKKNYQKITKIQIHLRQLSPETKKNYQRKQKKAR